MEEMAVAPFLTLVAGSTCKDWSSMGSQKGFFGPSTIAFIIMACLVRRVRPAVFLHECTRTFKWQIFQSDEGGAGLHGLVCGTGTPD